MKTDICGDLRSKPSPQVEDSRVAFLLMEFVDRYRFADDGFVKKIAPSHHGFQHDKLKLCLVYI